MAKEDVAHTPTDHEEVVVHPQRAKDGRISRQLPDTRTVVIAVGTIVILFIIGLILGYLLGHQSAENSRGSLNDTMMNGNARTYQYRTQ